MESSPIRYYGFDALRASMMILGVIFHLAIPYTGVDFNGYYVTHQKSAFLQILLLTHYFRMPAFFLLSGFFSSMVWQRRGTRGFLRVRSKRVGLVWVVALAIELPLVSLISVYNHFAGYSDNALRATWQAVTSLQIDSAWLQAAPLHLWFLEYLMLFSLVAAGVATLLKGALPVVDRWTGIIADSHFRVFALSVPTALSLYWMPLAVIPYPGGFIPWSGVAFTYGWFYAIGWLLYRRRDLLPAILCSTYWGKIAAPASLVLVFLSTRERRAMPQLADAPLLDAAIALSTAFFMWSTIVMLMAFFNRIQYNKFFSFLADASYWIYLSHYPIAALLPALMRYWTAPPVIKVGVASLLLVSFLSVIYKLVIQGTFVGATLTGLRPRVQAA